MTKHMTKPLTSPPLDDAVGAAATPAGTELSEKAQRSEPKRWLFIPAPPVPGRTRWCLNEK
jgi:hypothetical protein